MPLNCLGCFLVKNYRGVAQDDMIESIDVKFFPINELPDNISPPCVPALNKYKESVGV